MKEKKGFVVIIVLLAYVLIAGLAQGPAPALAENDREGQGVYRPSAIMVIQNKERGLIRTQQSRFVITSGTKILDSGGTAMTIRSLPVPCEAEVEYENYPYGDPVARKIVLRRAFPGASSQWSLPTPE
jgi:hypothetical protein